ncbi:MAG TPA: hypothetical protein VMV69_25760 [Pirellulales bacterium]|nr:hypothetical protein [Pirellulales bacterium]
MSNPPTMPVAVRGAAAAPLRWSARVRAAVSVLVALHVVALLVGPLSVPDSIVGRFLGQFYRPYLEIAYLNHGYKFFGPDPGPSHLVRYELELADGSRLKGIFPDRAEHWPRLLYHRHFMLSEFVMALSRPGDPGLPWEKQPLSQGQRVYARSYAHHLLEKHQGNRVTLYFVEHLIPSPKEVLDGMKLDDPRLYRTLKLGTYGADDFDDAVSTAMVAEARQ